MSIRPTVCPVGWRSFFFWVITFGGVASNPHQHVLCHKKVSAGGLRVGEGGLVREENDDTRGKDKHEARGKFWGCVCCEEMTWLNNNSTVVQFQKLFNKQFLCLHLNLTFSSSRWGRGNKRKWSEFEGQNLQEMSSRKGHACPLALLWMAILLTHWRGKQIWGVTNAALLPN